MEHFADHTLFDHFTRLSDDRIARIAVSHAEKQALFLRKVFQFLRLLYIHGYRLVAHHMNTLFQKAFCDFIVTDIGRHDADKINPVLPCSLFLCRFPIVPINPGSVLQLPDAGCFHTLFVISGKTTCRQFRQMIHLCAVSMGISNICADRSADHAVSQSFHRRLLFLYRSAFIIRTVFLFDNQSGATLKSTL